VGCETVEFVAISRDHCFKGNVCVLIPSSKSKYVASHWR
jgi:hypothetical protein